MKKTGRMALVVGFILVLAGFPTLSGATTITFTATDLVDTGGGDLWQYSYFVSAPTPPFPDADTGFTIYFDLDYYSGLAVGATPSGWDVIVAEPAPALSADGFFDAFALTSPAPLSSPFLVSFIWSGTGRPGSQPFEVYEFANINLPINIYETGRTTSPEVGVPEPGTLLLLGTGLLGLVATRRRRQR